MADGFTLRDFNKMSEEEVQEVTKGLPGFENMLSNLKKKDENEKPTGSFFTEAYGTLPSQFLEEPKWVTNPYAGTISEVQIYSSYSTALVANVNNRLSNL